MINLSFDISVIKEVKGTRSHLSVLNIFYHYQLIARIGCVNVIWVGNSIRSLCKHTQKKLCWHSYNENKETPLLLHFVKLLKTVLVLSYRLSHPLRIWIISSPSRNLEFRLHLAFLQLYCFRRLLAAA
jgi:hypothetical protein